MAQFDLLTGVSVSETLWQARERTVRSSVSGVCHGVCRVLCRDVRHRSGCDHVVGDKAIVARTCRRKQLHERVRARAPVGSLHHTVVPGVVLCCAPQAAAHSAGQTAEAIGRASREHIRRKATARVAAGAANPSVGAAARNRAGGKARTSSCCRRAGGRLILPRARRRCRLAVKDPWCEYEDFEIPGQIAENWSA